MRRATGLVLSGVIVFAQFTLFLIIGVLLYVFYQQTPLPRPLATNDEVLPLFVVTSLSHGAAGFIVAAIVAAALSPSINAQAATTVNDFYLKYVRPDADQVTLMRVSRAATIFWGVAQIGVALGAQWIRSVLDTGLAVLSLSAGPVLGAFLVGVLTTRVRFACDDHGHGRRRRRIDVGVVDGRDRLDVVRIHRIDRDVHDRARRVGRPACCRSMPERFPATSAIIRGAVARRAFPAAAIEVGRAGGPLWNQAFGTLTYDPGAFIAAPDTVFDIASLTKVIATTTLVMRAVDEGRLTLDAPISTWLSEWRGTDRNYVSIRDLLAHCSGLTAYLPFYREIQGRPDFQAGHLRAATRVSSAHAVDLQRPRLHPARVHPRGRGSSTCRTSGRSTTRSRSRARSPRSFSASLSRSTLET